MVLSNFEGLVDAFNESMLYPLIASLVKMNIYFLYTINYTPEGDSFEI